MKAMAEASEDPRIGRAAGTGAAIGFVSALVLVTAVGSASGMDVGSAVGLGTFVGIWGGAGFGFMMGATTALSRHTTGDAE
jgi:hypothetical protein